MKLVAIDWSTLAGKRDLALLSVGIQTGQRLSDLAGLLWGHIHQGEGDKLTLNWYRTKGDKKISDILMPDICR